MAVAFAIERAPLCGYPVAQRSAQNETFDIKCARRPSAEAGQRRTVVSGNQPPARTEQKYGARRLEARPRGVDRVTSGYADRDGRQNTDRRRTTERCRGLDMAVECDCHSRALLRGSAPGYSTNSRRVACVAGIRSVRSGCVDTKDEFASPISRITKLCRIRPPARRISCCRRSDRPILDRKGSPILQRHCEST
jgi:hypothetical protein